MAKIKTILAVICAILSLCFAACKEDDTYIIGCIHPREFFDLGPHFFFGFQLINDIDARQAINKQDVLLVIKGPRIWCTMTGCMLPPDAFPDDPDYEGPLLYGYKDFGDRMWKAFNDMTFCFNNQDESSQEWHTGTINGTTLEEDILNIELECLDDFDAAHPAGTSLTDIVSLEYVSFYEYVQQGYVWNEHSIGNGFDPEYRDLIKDERWANLLMTPILDSYQGYGEALNHIKLEDIPDNPVCGIEADRSLLYFHITPAPGTYRFKMTWTVQLHSKDYEPRQISTEFEMTF